MTMTSAICVGSIVRIGSGFGRAAMRPKYFSITGMISCAFTPPTMAVTMLAGT